MTNTNAWNSRARVLALVAVLIAALGLMGECEPIRPLPDTWEITSTR